MATVKRDTVSRERTVTDKVSVFHLTLEQDEARLLHTILCNVGGPREYGRKHADEVLTALSKAGVGSGYFATTGSIMIDDKQKAPKSVFEFNPFTTPQVSW